MTHLGKGRCACGSGLKFKKCCGASLPELNKESALTGTQLLRTTKALLSDYSTPFSSEVTINLSEAELVHRLTLAYGKESLSFAVKRSLGFNQARAFIAAHLEKLATQAQATELTN